MEEVKFRAIDGDGHVFEDITAIREHLEHPYCGYRDLWPQDGWQRDLGKERPYRGPASTAQDWIVALEKGNLECAVVYPTMGLFTPFILDRDYRFAFVRAYNNWLSEQVCSPSSGRIMGMGILPTHEPEEAAKELRRGVTELGLVGGLFPTDGFQFLLGNQKYDPVFEAAAELGVPIAIHGTGSHLGGAGVEMFSKFIQVHFLAHPFGILRQFTSMMFEGVFERHPSVRFAFLESGVTWVPWALDRMDDEFDHRGDVDAPTLKRKPSEYVRQGGNIFFGCEAGEKLLGPTLNLIGEDVVLYASDFPHWDGTYPRSLHELEEREDITESQRYGILRGAAKRLYNLGND